MERSMSQRPEVLIAGAGPVGLVTAIELARRGIRPVLLDSKEEIVWSSRAICISRRSQEIFRRIGVSQSFFDKALPWNSGKTFHRDRLVFRLEMPFGPADRFAPFVNIQQYYTERFLLDTLEELGGDAFEIRWGHSITGVDQGEGGRTVTVEGPGGRYDMAFDWLVAADGARSPVRTALGKPLRGTSYEGRYLIADIKVEGANWPVERHVWFDPVSNPKSTVIIHVQPDGVWRIDIQVDSSREDALLLDDAFLLPLIARHLSMVMGVDAGFEVIWRSVYRAHALSMDDYRDGHVLFAGDAAHLVPIFGVRGLNSGIDDAHNLAWKLAMVIDGRADQRLLDSYTEERRVATLENLGNAIKSTWFMSPPDTNFRLLRDSVLHLAETRPWARELINPRQSSAHIYRTSSVIGYDDGEPGIFEPGAVLPSLPMQDGRHLHDLLATDRLSLVLLGDFSCEAGFETLAGDAEALGLHLVVMTEGMVSCVSGLEPAERPLVLLVRPDEHIAARLPSLDRTGLRKAVERALGHAPGPRAPFVPVADVSAVVPYSVAEALFARLAATQQFTDDDPDAALKMLSEGMAAEAAAVQ